jgi:adenine-specific DNA methylase
MIPRECKRLAEVDFPIATVSRHAAREKSIRHGHPSTLHLWWARRPLAACRAVLLALLLPDPEDPQCPADFKTRARAILAAPLPRAGSSDVELRTALLRFIGDFANWDNSASPIYLEAGRALVKAAHPDEPPLVVDPFAGGGSIPLEALRLGCDAFASDLNPVACLILKVMLEDIPRSGPQFVEELLQVGAEIKAAAERELAQFYPLDPDGGRPIAYLWARTVRCEAPNCGAEIPLVRSFWLSKKAGRKRALRHAIERRRNQPPTVVFDIFEPVADSQVPRATVTRAKATCLCCGTTLAPDRVRTQLREKRGDADTTFDELGRRVGGALMIAVVLQRSASQGRQYRLPKARDYVAVRSAAASVARFIENKGSEARHPIPDEPTPRGGGAGAGRAFSIYNYGMKEWGDLFTMRQKLSLATFNSLFRQHMAKRSTSIIALAADKLADFNSSVARWAVPRETSAATFGRPALPITWDFCETVPIGASTGSFDGVLKYMLSNVRNIIALGLHPASVAQNDAKNIQLPSEAANCWFTDPPYYDAVPYADLSDFFFVWLKRAMPDNALLRDPSDLTNPLTPKIAEAVQDEAKSAHGRPKDRTFFENTMADAFAEGRRVTREDGIGSVVFAHKTTEGWEALLSGMIRGGWIITGSWPIATERPGRLRSQDSAALATSVHLVCRPRIEDRTGDWADVLRELPGRVTDWMVRLDREGVRGADLVFACIGPALEIFSRYSRVEKPDGSGVPLAEYLEKVWEVVGRAALEQVLGTAEAQARNGGAGALEEDARLTALFLWTLKSTATDGAVFDDAGDTGEDDSDDEGDSTEGKKSAKGFALAFDIVRRFAQPLGIHLENWEGRLIEIDKGIVRLMPISERARQLFGQEGAAGLAARIERAPDTAAQLSLFPEPVQSVGPRVKGRRRGAATPAAVPATAREATTLDRVHAAMLLQANGRANALRALIKAEQDRSPDFLRLANALIPLYPLGCDERRLLEALVLAMPR